MANRVIVAAFATQNHAYDAARHIQNLDKDGIIQLRRGAIVTKDAKGNLTIPDTKGVGAAWGLLGGGLIGARPDLIRADIEQSRLHELADDQADLLGAVIKQEQRHRIVMALQQLPFEQRQVIELNYFGGRSYPEIASALNHPLGTVKTRARRGLRKLKQALVAEGPRASLSL